MFIRNIESIKNVYKCNKRIANYLIRHKIPILSVKDKDYYFAETDALYKALDGLPWYLNILA